MINREDETRSYVQSTKMNRIAPDHSDHLQMGEPSAF